MHPKQNNPLIIVAPNGARRMKSDHPELPMTPAELAHTALQCADAGAAMIHMHARTNKGRHSLELDDNRRTYDAVKDAVGDRLIVQMTTEAVGLYLPNEQMHLINALKPEAASFGLRELIPNRASIAEAADFFHWVANQGILAQYILYSAEDLLFYKELLELRALPESNHHLLFVLGRYAKGQQSSPSDLDPFLAHTADLDARWAVCAFGSQELECLATAIGKGGDARIGFENNLLTPSGELAESNASQVAALYSTIEAQGLTPATAADARNLVFEPQLNFEQQQVRLN